MDIKFDEELFWEAAEEAKNGNLNFLKSKGGIYEHVQITEYQPAPSSPKNILIIIENERYELYLFTYDNHICNSGLIDKNIENGEMVDCSPEDTIELLKKFFPMEDEMIKEPDCY
jgi:hypothetical protein